MNVLQVQELCDLIADSLSDSSWALRSCSLISRPFTASAQRHLFHDIIFNRGCLAIDDLAIMNYDEASASRRFCAVMQASPHLVPLVRRLRVSLEQETLSELCKIDFPNLQDVVFHRRVGGPASDYVVTLGAQILASPSLRRIGLLSPIFTTIADLGRLFQNCAPRMDSLFIRDVSFEQMPDDGDSPLSPKVKIRALRLQPLYSQTPDWLLGSHSPFDFSALATLKSGSRMPSFLPKLLECARLTLTRVTIDAQGTVNPIYTNTPNSTLLARLPALTHLTIVSFANELQDVQILLAALPAGRRLAFLKLEIRNVRKLKAHMHVLQVIGGTCASAADSVSVHVRRVASGADSAELVVAVRSAFADLDGRGDLQVLVQ
ncbi:hypothetical protein DFH07DRAFT_223612 [Mycena maculata]|uniref:Uncharacterized protein n=1 Tax=Mycena maculata TaxID=230809 RepID=A0AAD7MQF8_9AGAR|nr:hypothetical protein DFH07DRAFT_223612 [Mycena maculata]